MSQLINNLATIEISQEIVNQLDLESIYSNFSKNYRKLDDLKDFRSDYEKKNKLMRWWHNDKLRDAQLDSAEVQAEFSKTIGQLMMISIMQSKKLAEQQQQLTAQQIKLKEQANGIAEQAQQLQEQHHTLAKQSEELERLVTEYFALKGLTEKGAEKLIAISKEIKGTKESMLQEFSQRAENMEAAQSSMLSKANDLCDHLSKQFQSHVDMNQSALSLLEYETRQTLVKSADDLRSEWHGSQEELRKDLASTDQLAQELQSQLQSSRSDLALHIDNMEKHGEELKQQQQATHTVLTDQSRKLESAHQRITTQEDKATVNENTIQQIQAQMLQSQADMKAQLRKMTVILTGVGLLATFALVGSTHLMHWF